MKLHPDYTGWTDVCEDCFSRIFRAYTGAWIAIADDQIMTVSSDCRRHRPINVEPPQDDQCPHGVPWRRCTDGCINVDMEYVPKHGHEVPTSVIIPRITFDGIKQLMDQKYPTTSVVTCCHCDQVVTRSQYWTNRWFDGTKGYRCNGLLHEPTIGAADGDKKPSEYWGANA